MIVADVDVQAECKWIIKWQNDHRVEAVEGPETDEAG